MTTLAAAVAASPVLAVTKEQARRRPGAVWREADRGTDLVVYGVQDSTAVLVTLATPEVLRFLGHDPDQVRALLDGPGDSLGPPEGS
jgi:hypothetical protein